ncbi:MAG: trypsin-like peptidase domain-containing protein [Thomasclavelia sp.]|jgi:serine protease Do|nr:trypsin-like peptidase domain-containing protein [Thomasclavelia sp.]
MEPNNNFNNNYNNNYQGYNNNPNQFNNGGFNQQMPPQKPKKELPKFFKTKLFQKVLYLVIVALVALGGAFAGVALGNSNSIVVNQSTSTNAKTTSKTSTLTSSELAKKVTPSVVAITTENVTTNNYWYGNQVESGAGSGVVISEDGYIITCAHVVSSANSIKVETSDGKEYTAKLVGSDTSQDIAVIKIEASGLTAATIADSDKVIQGEESFAVGNPEGNFSGSITSGIVSALNRSITVSLDDDSDSQQSNPYSSYQSSSNTVTLTVLQTDAAVSPGNSGGGLFNADGELIGIVNAKSSDTDSEGLGFAIPSNTAIKIAKEIMQK